MAHRASRSLVTGASSGIGAAFARALAARGSDLVLVARRTDRLRELASELEGAHGIRAEVVTADLSEPAAGRALRAAISGDVDTVINNAGFGDHDALVDAEPEVLEHMIAVDVTALVDITRAFLPAMLQRRHGAIVNIASTAGFQPVPLMAVYGASKAFVLSFSEAVWQEAKPHGVRCWRSHPVSPGPSSSRSRATRMPRWASRALRRMSRPPACAPWTGGRRRPMSSTGRAMRCRPSHPGWRPAAR